MYLKNENKYKEHIYVPTACYNQYKHTVTRVCCVFPLLNICSDGANG